MHASQKPHKRAVSRPFYIPMNDQERLESPSVAAVSRPQRAARQSQMLRIEPLSMCPVFQMQIAISSSPQSGRSSS